MRPYEDGLRRLRSDRIDILLAHDIGAFQHGEENNCHFGDLKKSSYRAMAELREQGLVKGVGLGITRTRLVLMRWKSVSGMSF